MGFNSAFKGLREKSLLSVGIIRNMSIQCADRLKIFECYSRVRISKQCASKGKFNGLPHLVSPLNNFKKMFTG